MRIAPGPDGVSIWSTALFGGDEPGVIRDFLARSFAVPDIVSVELRRAEHFGRITYRESGQAAEIWRRLSRVLRPGGGRRGGASRAYASADIADLYLDWPSARPLTILRVGETLTSWQVRRAEADRVRLFHPALLRRRDVAFRLKERLAGIVGCERVGANILLGELSVRYRPEALSLDILLRELERAWDSVLNGADAPLPRGRLLAASGLIGLGYAGQFLFPALRPAAMLGVALYGLPNVVATLRELRELKVGLPALYATALVLTLVRGMPFHTSVMALLLQIWPRLAFLAFSRSQRRLFRPIRRRALALRVAGPGGALLLRDIETVSAGDIVVVRAGEIIPVDGTVTDGRATLDESALAGGPALAEAGPGTRVHAASEVLAGEIRVRVERVGRGTVAATIAARLPVTHFSGLPSSADVDRIAARNARPALAIGLASLAATRLIRPAQVILRPDFVTAPRLGAQLGALGDVAEGLAAGIFFRTPAALDRLAAVNVLIFDDSAGLDRRRLDVADIVAVGALAPTALLALAAGGFGAASGEVAEALRRACAEREVAPAAAGQPSRTPGRVRYSAADGAWIDVATEAAAAEAGWELPEALAEGLSGPPRASARRGRRRTTRGPDDGRAPAGHRLLVRRDGVVVGAVRLLHRGDLVATTLIAALRILRPDARIVHVSGRSQAQAEALAHQVGISIVHAGLRDEEKAAVVVTYGARTVFVGDGAAPRSAAAMEEAMVSVSVGGLASVPEDAADVVLLTGGIERLAALWAIVAARRARIDASYRALYATNLAAVAAALVGGFGSFEVGLVSNAATALHLTRLWGRLSALGQDSGVPGSAGFDGLELDAAFDSFEAVEAMAEAAGEGGEASDAFDSADGSGGADGGE